MRTTSLGRKGVFEAPYRLRASVALLVVFLIAGGFVSLWMGQDINWDLKNYHFYNVWAYLDGRLRTDLFAAGVQTYFSPLLDMPYYLLSMGWLKDHPRLLAFVMGLPLGALLFFSFQIAWTVSSPYIARKWVRVIACFAAVGFGCSGVAVVVQIGSTMDEVPVAALVVAGLWLLLLYSQSSGDWTRKRLVLISLSGVLFGLAAALKFTAAIYAPGAGLICLMLPGSIVKRLLRATLFSLAWLAMVAIFWAPWGVYIYRLTGNPLFPLFNQIFRSTWSAPMAWRDLHAMPTGMIQAIFYPFYWISSNLTVLELQFSDSRYAITYVLLLVWIFAKIVSRFLVRRNSPQRLPIKNDTASVGFVLYFIVTYVIWEAEFSILRYTAALVSVSGVIVLIACGSVYGVSRLSRLTKHVAVAGVVLASAALLWSSEYPSFGRIAYGKTVWSVDAPAVKPGSTILLADSPTAFIAPFIAKKSHDISFIGLPFYLAAPIFSDFQLGAKVRHRIAQASNLYVLTYEDMIPPTKMLADFGVTIDFRSCAEISTNVSAGMTICAARHVGSGSSVIDQKFSLEPVLVSNSTTMKVSIITSAECMSVASPQTATIRYTAPQGVAAVKLYVQPSPGKNLLFGSGPRASSLKTGPWVMGGQHVIFTDLSGNRLADYVLQYVPCR